MANMGERMVIRLRRGYAVDWADVNPILELGEPGYERDTGKLKIGDGKTNWNGLEYFAAGDGSASIETAINTALNDHVNDQTPHPVYDDGPSFILLYENAKV